jgi:hypothetical protein
MILAHPVFHPIRPEIVLLRPGAELDRFGIPRLKELGVHEVWIRYPGMEKLIEFVNPKIVDAYRGLINQMGLTLDAAMVGSQAHLEYGTFRFAMVQLLHEVAADQKASALIGEVVRGSKPFMRHAGSTCLLSILLGLRTDHYICHERSRMGVTTPKDFAALGVGAMFHDIGLLKLDPRVLAEWSKTRDESDTLWRHHVQTGFNMVRESIDPCAAAVVLHHHQRVDGSGFPSRRHISGTDIPVSGSHIHIFARIAAVADVFDRLHYPAHLPGETELPGLPTVRVLAELQRPPYTHILDATVLQALHDVAAPYPPGLVVTLSDGREAAVVNWSRKNPCRPTVMPLGDVTRMSRRDDAIPEPIDLAENPELSISKVQDVDVSLDNYPPPALIPRIPTMT